MYAERGPDEFQISAGFDQKIDSKAKRHRTNSDTLVDFKPPRKSRRFWGIAFSALFALVLFEFLHGFFLVSHASQKSNYSEVMVGIGSCTSINASGIYYLQGNITSHTNGTCITVSANNVSIRGDNHYIIAIGNASNAGSYGLLVKGSYANISRINVTGFGHGVYLGNSNRSRLYYLNVTGTRTSGITLENSWSDLVYGSSVLGSLGRGGGINITGGGNNLLYSDSADYGSYYGIILSNTLGNNINGTSMQENPVDIACFDSANLKTSNRFAGSYCSINNFCNFAHCVNINYMYLVSDKALGSVISTCGSINEPGIYSLSSDISLSDYLNVSTHYLNGLPCIIVNSSNVAVDCNGHTIRNAQYGILAQGKENVTVSDCRMVNNTYATYFNNNLGFKIYSVQLDGNGYGIYINRSQDGSLQGIRARGNTYGIYINGTTQQAISNFSADLNYYGIAIDNSSSISISNGTSLQNSRADLFCTTSTYNSKNMSASKLNCSNTDCNWAVDQCTSRFLPSLSTYPVSECMIMNAPGRYTISGNISATGSCFDITSSNVRINCTPGSLISSTTNIGNAFEMSGVRNVSIFGCNISEFNNGLVANYSSKLALNNMSMQFVYDGFEISNSSNDSLSNDTVTRFSAQAFSFVGMNYSKVIDSKANSGLQGYGFNFSGAFNNIIVNNTANLTGYGFYMIHSRNNTIYENHVYSQWGLGYYCDPYSAGVYAQKGGLNYGVANINCNWLVEIPPVFTQNICTLITASDTISLTHDMLYTAGGTCFSIRSSGAHSAKGTTINCNGNTMMAINGGRFLYSYNTSDVTLENCVLIGFTDAAVFSSKKQVSGISVINNTFAGNSNTSIYINNAELAIIYKNLILNSSVGAYMYGFNNSIIKNNTIGNTNTGIMLNGSSESQIMNNTVSGSGLGVSIYNSQFTRVMGNLEYETANGFRCYGSGKLPNNIDLGGNICSNVEGCTWMNITECT